MSSGARVSFLEKGSAFQVEDSAVRTVGSKAWRHLVSLLGSWLRPAETSAVRLRASCGSGGVGVSTLSWRAERFGVRRRCACTSAAIVEGRVGGLQCESSVPGGRVRARTLLF
jgi:hypothetical protein